MMKKIMLWLLPVMLFSACAEDIPVYKNPNKPVEARVKDLLKRMTLEEKTAQMQDFKINWVMTDGRLDRAKMDSAFHGVSYGAMFNIKLTAEDLAQQLGEFKKYNAEHSRLGIPVPGVAESLHGLIQEGATIFPQAVALGSTFDPELVGRVAGAIAGEAKAAGVDQVLSPVLDIARELRWGRVEETYGEDPYLIGRMGVAYVKAFNERAIITTPKHFTAHGTPQAGLNLASVAGGERELRSIYLKPFVAVIDETNPYSIMNAYSCYDGQPLASSKYLLTDVLRGELGFKGFVSSDWESVRMLWNFQKTAETKADAGRQAVLAGLDMEVDSDCYESLDSLVQVGALSEKDIDKCVERILTAKFEMGLFEDPNISTAENLRKVIHGPEAIALALESARESVVLVENKGNVLPLDRNKLRSVAVIGPNAARVQFGDYMWTNDSKYGVTPLQGIRELAGERVKINYAFGCDIHTQDRNGFAEAVTAARMSDIAVVFIGGMSGAPGRPVQNAISGESYDLHDIALTGVQEELVKAVNATGKPVVVVFVAGKPSAMPWIREHCEGVVVQWYGGEQQGNAIAEVLFGEVNPSGKLNVSFPKSTGHLPCFYNRYPSDNGFYNIRGTEDKPGRDYVFSDPYPVWAFGHGLSYTTFEYRSVNVSKDELTASETCRIEVEVKNTGDRDGKEVVQLYVNDVVSSVATPVKELKRFEKMMIKAGETVTVVFELPMKELSLWNADMKEVVEPGEFELQIGTASDNILLTKIINVI